MDVLHAIAKRRSVRDFDSRSMSREDARTLIEAAVLAPSARNLQPWSFAVLLNRDQINSYAEQAREWLLEHSPADDLLEMMQAPGFSLFHHAPALTLIHATDKTTQSAEDCCLAAQNFVLAARALGLGTCWIGLARPWLDLPETKAELGLPQHYRVAAPIVFGHPCLWPKPQERRRPEIHWLGA